MTYYGNTRFGYSQGCPQHSSLGAPPFHKSVPPLEGLVYQEPLFLEPSFPWLSG